MKESSIHNFLIDIGRYPLLTPEQELLLWRQIQAMNKVLVSTETYSPQQLRIINIGKRAKERFINSNLRMVVNIAKKNVHKTKHLELADLISEGNIGLIRAVEKFDGARGYRFSTYAYWWIKQAISRAITTKERSIRLPINVEEIVAKMTKAKAKLAQQFGRFPTDKEVATEIKVNEQTVRQIQNTYNTVLSLDIKLNDRGKSESDSLTLIDLISNETTEHDVYDTMDTELQVSRVMLALDFLTPDERYVLTHRWGLCGHKPCTFSSLSVQLKMSKDCLRRMCSSAEQKVRSYLTKMGHDHDAVMHRSSNPVFQLALAV